MAGYREHSYDPNGDWGQQGRPLRPFNWVQWTGVAIEVVALGGLLAYVAGRVGIIPDWIDGAFPLIMLAPIGSVLITSRRESAHDPAPDLAAARKRWLIIVVALCFAIFGAALAIEFTGAK